MINIFGVNINKKKKIVFGIIKIFGIGSKNSKKICKNFINKNFYEINKLEFDELLNKISNYLIENKLRLLLKNNMKKLLELNNYRCNRHIKKLPCRGQRTKTNSKCRKKMMHEVL